MRLESTDLSILLAKQTKVHLIKYQQVVQENIMKKAGEMLAKVENNWAFVNYEKQRPTRILEEVASSFKIVEQ